jgi:hypothetical protein
VWGWHLVNWKYVASSRTAIVVEKFLLAKTRVSFLSIILFMHTLVIDIDTFTDAMRKGNNGKCRECAIVDG